MLRSLIVALAGVLLAGPIQAHGQEATERFIPIGQSPGLSGRATYVGSLQSVQTAQRQITVASGGSAHELKLTDQTRVWIDRSKSRQQNLKGSVADLRAGRRVEVKWDSKDRSRAEWIKVEEPAVQ